MRVPTMILSLTLGLSTAYADEPQRLSTEYQNVMLTQLVDGLEHPWSLAFLPDGSMLITERTGQLRHYDGTGEPATISGVPTVAARGQGGLLEVLPHPDFADNNLIYLTYSKPHSDGVNSATALARGRLDNGELKDLEDLFVQERYSSPGRHYGSKLAWTADGLLLMSIGDRGAEPPRAQDLGDHAGKLLRLTADGAPAPGNPFAETEGALAEIYTLGNRNIQGLMVDPDSGVIWATEHGPRGGDELNRMEPGNNYGWPVVSLGRSYRTEERYFPETLRQHPDMIDPILEWTPSIAASGLVKVPDDSGFVRWRGNFLAGGLRSEQLRRVVFDDGVPVHQEEVLRGRMGRVRDVRLGPDGNIYVLTDSDNGGLWRITPAD